jgi:hypothetical protein
LLQYVYVSLVGVCVAVGVGFGVAVGVGEAVAYKVPNQVLAA